MISFSLILLSGCATSTPTPKDLMSLPSAEVYEKIVTVNTPLAIVYQNILDKTRNCWRKIYAGHADSDPFISEIGYARISFSLSGGTLPNVTLAAYDLFPTSVNTTKIIGRHNAMTATWAKINLEGWANGTEPECWLAKPE